MSSRKVQQAQLHPGDYQSKPPAGLVQVHHKLPEGTVWRGAGRSKAVVLQHMGLSLPYCSMQAGKWLQYDSALPRVVAPSLA